MSTRVLILTLISFLGTASSVNAQNFISHDFDNGNFGAFKECTTQSPNYARVENDRVKTFWKESSYNGTRMTKGAEVCSKEDWSTRKEGWYGLTMNLGSDYPNDKRAGVAQIFQFVNSNFWTWAAMLLIDDGDLTFLHRDNGGTSQNSEEVIYSNLPKNQDFDIIMHFILSNQNRGELQVWIDGVSRYHKTNINFGFGSWSNDTQSGEHTYVDLKAGQYNFESDDYDNGETRTVYYDNIAWFNGANGYDMVDPRGNPSSENTTPSVSFSKPTLNQKFEQGEDPIVNVQASDDGSINSVKLYLDGVFLRQEVYAPYEWNHTSTLDPDLKNLAAGTYTLTAVAEDNTGLTSESNTTFSVEYGDSTDCDTSWSDAGFSVTANSRIYNSGQIDISCMNGATLSLNIEGVGPMESADYLDVYYVIDGGNRVTLAKKVDSFSKELLVADNLAGNTLEILIITRNSYRDETYYISDIQVSASGTTPTPTPTEPPSNNIVVLQKQNTSFSIDGNRGAIEGQEVYLWDTDTNNVNQQWLETNLGSGYYSLSKVDTHLCLDGGAGGSRRQPITLEACNSGDYDQQWKKVPLSNGSFRFEKRDTNFSIDGNRGAERRQQIYLWDSSNSNVNQQWESL